MKFVPLIKLRVVLNNKKNVTSVYDSGASATLINGDIIRELKAKMIKEKHAFRTIGGRNFAEGRAKLTLKIGGIEKDLDVFVVRNNHINYDLLLGLDAIQKFKLMQDENLNVFQRSGEMYRNVSHSSNQAQSNERNSEIKLLSTEFFGDQFGEIVNYLPETKRWKMVALMKRFKTVFAIDKFDVGTVANCVAEIKLLEDRYVAKKPYRCSLPDQKEIESQISELLKKGLIEESCAAFASPVTLAFKKEEGRRSRLCIDYRDLNKLVVPEPQPFPRIEDIVVKAGNCKWFSTLDINSAFWSIPVRERDRPKTAFVTQTGHFQWTCLPFGLKISPSIFQRCLANIIRRNKLQSFCTNYIDDILIFSETFENHMVHIEKVLIALRNEGFKLKLSKCDFARDSVKYLGHVLEYNGIRPTTDNLRAIRDFATPKSKKNVRQLLGKINFYYKYIENACKELEPLHNLLRKGVEFRWTEDCERSFQRIKNYLCSSPILGIYDPNRPVIIYTDASGEGIGAILKQPQDDNILHPVAYFSRKLKPSERKRKAIHLECLAIKQAIVYWQHWLIGRHFTIITDHKPLETLKVKARTDETLGDLVFYLSQYNFTIKYAAGKDNVEADSLSRNPVLESFENDDDVLKVVNLVTLERIIDDQEANQREIKASKNTIKKNDVIYKCLKNDPRIFISTAFGRELIQKLHEFYGHIGKHHLALNIRPFYYFKNMDQMIENFCKSCETCIQNKTRSGRPIGKLSKLGPATRPYEIMSIDTIGGFAGNRSSKTYMHLLVDHFTRKAFISTSKHQTTREFIDLIARVTNKESVRILLADQYSALNAKQLKDYLRERKIKLLFTSVNCPESNGLNERLNQTLVNRIRCKINSRPNRAWPTIAKECVDDYNRTTHSVTKFSPEYLMNGNDSHIIPSSLITKRDLSKDRAEALLNSIRNFEANKIRIDKNRRNHVFKENDLVYVENGNKLNRNKLHKIRLGPFRIIRQISDTMFEIDCGKKKREANVFHSTKLVPIENERSVKVQETC